MRLEDIQRSMREVHLGALSANEKDFQFRLLQAKVMWIVVKAPALWPAGFSMPTDAGDDRIQHDWARLAEAVAAVDSSVTAPSKIAMRVPLIGTANAIYRHPAGRENQFREMALELVAHLIGRTDDIAKPKPLKKNGNAWRVFKILSELKPHEALTGPQIVDAFLKQFDDNVDESSLRRYAFPELEPYGLKHETGKGYWIENR